MAKSEDMIFKIHTTLKNSENVLIFGPGIAQLMEGVREYGSLLRATQEMKMAYSKAWKIVRDIEESLGFQIILRHAGRGCGSQLTAEGVALLESYKKFIADIDQAAQASFAKNFSRYWE